MGFDWLQSFLRRNPDLSIRKLDGVSLARSRGMNKKDVSDYFDLLEQVILENELIEKPGSLFNMDETGLQLNNKHAFVVAQKGSKNLASVTSSEKGEQLHVSPVAMLRVTFFLRPAYSKAELKKQEFEDGMLPASKVYINEKSAYINTDIFIDWLTHYFVPRKPSRKVLMVLDGHACYCNSVQMLEYGDENEIILTVTNDQLNY
ncbi:uncharacterized protein [Diabrotica undecimpunctata]|uniref:uncharacterized protein n=1 Tax=Diabrotica undecimpunctata TaxID=50387 RepID=UPI003B635F60